jgi:uncharacterized protein (DUF4415 family)
MREKNMKKGTSKRRSQAQEVELAALAAMPEDVIDTSDIPEVLDWSGAQRGLFYRPVKQQMTLRLDADVIAWFKQHASAEEGYQTRINRALREYVSENSRKGRADHRRPRNDRVGKG